ncbi:hypothetical protein HZC09_05305, partial [Candidatus Micrarchaeota archaeon]|nr:hypothetical protein [Candidatus Micrarchaeota archaeon]
PEVKAKGSKVESKINQFMSADKVTAYLALNGGGNIIVPEFYRDWIVFVNAWTRWDLYLSAGFAIASIGAVKNLEQAKKMKAEAAERVKVREGSMLGKAEMEARLYGDVQSQGGKILLDKPVTTPKGIADRVAISPDGKKLQYFSGSGAPLFEREGVSNLVEAEAVDSSLRFKRKGGLQADIDEADVNIMRFKQMKQSLVSRVGASYMLAGGWLGSARLLYGINEGMLFRASVGDKDSKEKDKYLRLLVNKPVMEDFRSASGILSIGRVQEVIAKYVDSGFVPEKAFFPKKQILLNYPEPSAQVKSDAPQLTGFKSTGTDFTVYSNWRGNSYTLNYEDLRNFGGHDPFTALSVVAYGIIAEPSLYKKDLKAFTLLFSLAIPFMASRRLLDLEESALGAAVFLTTLEFLQIPSDLGDPDTCDMNKMNEFKDKFRLAFAGSVAATLVSVWIPFSKATGFLKQFGVSAAKWIDWVNPSDIWKWWIGDAAIAYASNCKDQMHTILSYQKIPDAVAPAEGNVITEKLPFLQSLSLPRVLAATEEEQKYEKAIKKLSEIMNLRVVLLNQKSFFYTPELLYAHIIESELSVKTSLYDIIADGCSLPERLQSSDGRSITINEKGLNAYDENGNPVLAFQSTMWKLRSLARLRSQALAKTIIPNKIISSTLSGQGESVFLLVSGTGDSTIVTPPCNLREAIEAVTGRNIGSDFTRAVGKTKFIETDAGKVGIEGGRIYFVKEFGTAVTSPSADDLRKSISEGARVEIRNNGEVIVFGPPGGEFKQISAGTFKTLLAEDGRVEHDTSSGTISVIIYSIFKTSAQNFAGYTVSPKGKGVSISAKPKAGQEASADKLNKAIDKIAGENGLTMFETKDHIYYITPDGKLRVMDKKTGTSSEYNLTGQPYQDGNQIVIPTDSGPLRLTLSNDNGVPTLQAQGLGLDELLPLLTARGQNGILTFNPSTGAINVYNGQDIPMNPAFAEKGIGFTGNDDGSSQGVPMNNPFTQSASTGTTTDNTPKLSLPAWPTDLAALLFVMLALLGAVVAVRFREN